MAEILVILSPNATDAERDEIAGIAAPQHSVSERVYVAEAGAQAEALLRAHPLVECVFTGSEGETALPVMPEGESLFARGWMQAAERG